MIPEIKELIFYSHIHLRESLLNSKDTERIKRTSEILEKLYFICPESRNTFNIILNDLKKGNEYLTHKSLLKILQKHHPKEMLNLSWGELMKKCIVQTGEIN